eukprot:gb/GECH01008053.1/.p1 GENE.gb/GECH01008053.1/~~gb/GECH01008053.1/.p1  ORF type:complete len:316 (+),score=65.43 gb/GECH01008053.1/:1-948(+)
MVLQEPIIELEDIQKTYLLGVEGVPALRGVSLKIMKGEFLIVYGTSGGGKTSLLNIIGTIDKPTKGYLSVGGDRISERTSDTTLANIRLKKIGFVFQTFNLLSTLTALENVEMPMILSGGVSKGYRKSRAKKLLGQVGMGERLTHVPSQLSGGEQQRVTIARALANEPDILLLDEPTGDLDTVNTLIVMDMLLKLNQEQNITMVMVTHDPNLKDLAHRIVSMRDGKIQSIDTTNPQVRNAAVEKVSQGMTEITLSQEGGHKKREKTKTAVRKPTDYSTYSSKGNVEFTRRNKTKTREIKHENTSTRNGGPFVRVE